MVLLCVLCFFQAEDGIRDLVRSRGLGDVYKRQTVASLGHLLSTKASLRVLALSVQVARDRGLLLALLVRQGGARPVSRLTGKLATHILSWTHPLATPSS